MNIVDTFPAAEPVTLQQARAHLKLDVVDGVHPEDSLVTDLIYAAREHIEQLTQTIVAERSVTISLYDFTGDELNLGIAPVKSVTTVMYEAYPNGYMTLPAAAYKLDASKPAKLLANMPFPATVGRSGSVTVGVVAGYAPADCPKSLKQAILLLVGHWYENREAVQDAASSRTPVELPKGVDALLAPYRLGMGL